MNLRYAEYGKQFIPSGATDFLTLSYSDIDTAEKTTQFRNALSYPESSSFSLATPEEKRVSAALVSIHEEYLFVQMQRRREGEILTERGEKARTNRPFNQIRFTLLSVAEIRTLFAQKQTTFTNLLHNKTKETYRLQAYERLVGQEPYSFKGSTINLQGFQKASPQIYKYAQALANELVGSHDMASPLQQTIAIIAPELKHDDSGMEIEQKLHLLQIMQYWAYPRIGVVTFALDYITKQQVRLLLLSDDVTGEMERKPRTLYLQELMTKQWAFDYVAKVEQIERTNTLELYGNELALFIKQPKIGIGNALALAELVTQGHQYPNRIVAKSIVCDFIERVEDENFDYARLIDALPDDELREILSNPKTGERTTTKILWYAYERSKGQIDKYLSYHAALSGDKQTLDNVQRCFQNSISSSPISALDNIPISLRQSFFENLIALRYKHPPIKPNQSRLLEFAPEGHGKHVTVLQALIGLKETTLDTVLRDMMVQDTRNILFNELLQEIKDNYQPEKLIWLCGLRENFSSSDYANALNQYFGQQNIVLQDSKVLSAILQNGSAYLKQDLTSDSRQSVGINSVPYLHTLQTRKPLYAKLRKLAIDSATTDIRFAEWLFFNELVYFPDSDFRDDYCELRDKLAPEPIRKSGSLEFQYLILPHDERPLGMTLRKACRQQQPIYDKLAKTWIATKTRFSLEDVHELINSLPDKQANALLASLIKSGHYSALLAKLDSQSVILWLESTRPNTSGNENLRRPYIIGRQDRLLGLAKKLEEPDESLIWYVLDTEIGDSNPGQYLAECEEWLKNPSVRSMRAETQLNKFLNTAAQLKKHQYIPKNTDKDLIALLSGNKNWADFPNSRQIKKLLPAVLGVQQNIAEQNLQTRSNNLLKEFIHSGPKDSALATLSRAELQQLNTVVNQLPFDTTDTELYIQSLIENLRPSASIVATETQTNVEKEQVHSNRVFSFWKKSKPTDDNIQEPSHILPDNQFPSRNVVKNLIDQDFDNNTTPSTNRYWRSMVILVIIALLMLIAFIILFF